MRGLYHYTCASHLPSILNSGFLRLSQGILDDYVVWLTVSNQSVGNGLEGGIADKGEIQRELINK